MKLVFVRHGPKKRDDTLSDAELPLDPAFHHLGHRLAEALASRELTPRVIVSSRYRHALDTAELLRGTRTRHIIPVTALTPHTPESDFTMSTIVAEAMAAGVDLLRDCDVLMLTGHEDRLSNLAHQLVPENAKGPQLQAFEALVLRWDRSFQERIDPEKE